MSNSINGVYKLVTEKIVKALEQGVIVWQKPWTGGNADGFISHTNGKAYSQLNSWLIALDGGTPGEYLTMAQAEKEGGKVKKGSKSKMVVFFKKNVSYEKQVNEEGEEVDVAILKGFTLRYYTVFHINDCEGIKPKYSIDATKSASTLSPIESAEEVVNAYDKQETTLTIQRDKESPDAFFSPSKDLVVVPQIGQYKDVNEYYSTLFHELTHSTGVKSRCDRGLEKNAAFGSETYSAEELVAEIGSAMCIHRLGLEADKAFKNSVAYIQGWSKYLKNDPKAIVFAASKAEKAVSYIFGDN